jgi:hypothetical protein
MKSIESQLTIQCYVPEDGTLHLNLGLPMFLLPCETGNLHNFRQNICMFAVTGFNFSITRTIEIFVCIVIRTFMEAYARA